MGEIRCAASVKSFPAHLLAKMTEEFPAEYVNCHMCGDQLVISPGSYNQDDILACYTCGKGQDNYTALLEDLRGKSFPRNEVTKILETLLDSVTQAEREKLLQAGANVDGFAQMFQITLTD